MPRPRSRRARAHGELGVQYPYGRGQRREPMCAAGNCALDCGTSARAQTRTQLTGDRAQPAHTSHSAAWPWELALESGCYSCRDVWSAITHIGVPVCARGDAIYKLQTAAGAAPLRSTFSSHRTPHTCFSAQRGAIHLQANMHLSHLHLALTTAPSQRRTTIVCVRNHIPTVRCACVRAWGVATVGVYTHTYRNTHIVTHIS
jgi:hypothetical protein|eukprot:7244927-Prymnesium_polylepis.1